MNRDLTINIPGYEIKAQAFGQEENPVILALHGWLDNSNSFLDLAHALVNDFYFIAIDLPGHGHSSHLPEGMNYHFVDSVMIINDIIQHLGHKNIILMGHSMGACMASLAVPFLTDKPKALVLIEGLGPLTHHPEDTFKYLNQFMVKINHTKQLPLKKMNHIDEAAQARSRRGHVSFDIAKKLCIRGTKIINHHYYWRHDPRLLVGSPLRMTEEQVLNCLSHIQIKTLLIEASQGFDFGSSTMEKRISTVKDITVKSIDGGHHVHMEKPEEVAKLIKRFLQSQS